MIKLTKLFSRKKIVLATTFVIATILIISYSNLTTAHMSSKESLEDNSPVANDTVPTKSDLESEFIDDESSLSNTIGQAELKEEPPLVSAEYKILVNKQNELSKDFIPKTGVPKVNSSSTIYVRKDIISNVESLFKDAKKVGMNLLLVSGYRSYNSQRSVYNRNLNNKGLEWTQKYSAKPGQSEHQTGLAIDVSSNNHGTSLYQSFGQTKEGIWLKDNCSNYGFIIRYLPGKEDITGYYYEPWHLRYVGKEVSNYIMDNNLSYEEYLDLIN